MNKKVVSLLATGLLCSQFLMPLTSFAATKTRLGGSDRYQTAIAIADKYWSSGSNYAVLARGDDFADALCSGPLAYAYNAPVLLTNTDWLRPEVLAELKKLNVKTLFIAGGNGAISDGVKNAITSADPAITTVTRLGGQNRYETSSLIADAVKAKDGAPTSIAVATGENYPDALSIASIAAKNKMPILLTNVSSLPDSVNNFIKSNSTIAKSYVVGGTGVVNDAVKGSLPSAVRLGGHNRYDTNLAVLECFRDSLTFDNTFVAVGDGAHADEGFPDALAGAPAAALNNAPIVLAYNTLDGNIKDYLSTKLSANNNITALGGTAVLPDTVVDSVTADYVLPTVNTASLTDGTNTVNAVINNNDNSIKFTLINGVDTYNNGSASINEDLASAVIKYKNSGATSTVSSVKTTDSFSAIISDAMAKEGYNLKDGVKASNISYLLNGATLTLTDNRGSSRTYTIVITE